MSESKTYYTNFASLTRRFLAFVLDGMILSVPMGVSNYFAPVVGSVVVWVLYAPFFESSELRATLGKYLMGIQVTDPAGRRISFGTSLARNALKVVSGVIFCIGYFFAFFSSQKQTLHDLLAHTWVVYGRSDRSIATAWNQSFQAVINPGASSSGYDSSVLSQLERLDGLRARGTITEEEFMAEKKKILG
jgi:uncharacterized RDD family membrane protein YckC